MKLKDMSIRSRMVTGISLMLILVGILGFVGVVQTNKLWRSTKNLYEHPFHVATTMRDIRGNIHTIREMMVEIAMKPDMDIGSMRHNAYRIDSLERLIYEQFELVGERYLGPKKDVITARKSFAEYKFHRDRIIEFRSKGMYEQAVEYRYKYSLPFINSYMKNIETIVNFADNKAKSFMDSAQRERDLLFRQMVLLIVLIMFVSALTGFFMIRSVRAPVRDLTEIARRFQNGDFQARSDNDSKNELGVLAGVFNDLADRVERDLIVKDGIAQIASSVLKTNEPAIFGQNLLNALIQQTQAVGGALYLLNREKMVYEPFCSVGMDENRLRVFKADPPEGEPGLAVSTGEIQVIRSIPEDSRFVFPSVSGTLYPRSLLTIPVLDKEQVAAVISLSSLDVFTENALSVIRESWPTITTGINGMLGHHKTILYAQKLDQQNIELAQKSHELKIQADELKEYNVELELQKKQLNEANRLKSEFLSNMSHELRTPLNSILALSGVLIARTRDRLSKEESSYLEIVERNGRNLLNLINDILDLSKIEAGKLDLNPQNITVASLLRGLEESFLPLAQSRGLSFVTRIPDKELMIKNDPEKVRQILTNLIGNAIKFTTTGGITIECKANVQQVEIMVSDTGIGISRENLPHIFEKFRQVDGSSSRRHEGTGLGLAIVQELVKRLGAGIRVESEVGKGSRFILVLPREWKGDNNPLPVQSFIPAEIQQSDRTVLIVDDDPGVVHELSGYLREAGYNTIESTDGSQVLQMAKMYRPFAITLDVIMPGMDGWEVLQKLKQDPETHDIPVIMVSVSSDKETGIALGAVGHIIKPVDRSTVLNEFNKLRSFPSLVMVVDDNPTDLESMAGIIENENIRVIRAKGGQECLEMMNTLKPDVLVLDLNMPETDGFMVLDRLHRNAETMNIPVIIATAKDLSPEEKLLLNGKVVSILLKNQTTAHQIFDEVSRILKRLEHMALREKSGNQEFPKRILIIEDNPDAIVQIKMVLRNEGYLVDVASSGFEAIAYVAHTLPDGIILDLMMPGMDGFEVLERIRGTLKTAHIPVLVLTAKTLTRDDLGKLSANNVQQLVQKGRIDLDSLLGKIHGMMNPAGKSLKKENPHPEILPDQKITPADILIVEDHPDNLVSLKAMLPDTVKIAEATNGESALALIHTQNFSLILLDISLPGMSGTEVLQKIRRTEGLEALPVVAVTARAMKGDREELISLGFTDYLSKPVDQLQLNAVIERYIGKQ